MTSIQSGESGVLGQEWALQNNRRNAVSKLYGTNGKTDLESSMSLLGIDKKSALDTIEYTIVGDRTYDGTLLDWQASAWSAGNCDDRLFQGSNYDLYTNVDLEKGTYLIMDERTLTEELGMDWSGGKPYDVLEIKNNDVNFYDFVFCGEEDGKQDSLDIQLNQLTNARWGVNQYEIREVNTDLLKAAVGGPGDNTESRLAYDTYNIMKDSLPMWATNEIKEALADLEPDSDEYYQKFIEYAIQTMDNEGYTEGNSIASPEKGDQADTQLNKLNSTKEGFNVVRGENGQVRVALNNVKNLDVNGAGSVTGSAVFSMGETSDGNSVVQIGQTKYGRELNISIDSTPNNLEFYGENVNANFNSKVAKNYNVQWNASNSSLNSTKGSGTMYINTSENASNNTFNVGDSKTKVQGTYDNVLIDNGKNNVYKSESDSTNLFITSETSDGALIYAGDGENKVLVGGKNGIYVGGAGKDHIVTDANSKNNLLFGMDGDDVIDEYGQHNTFLGGKGKDEYNSYGKDNLANLGNGEDYELHLKAGSGNSIFTGEGLDGNNYVDFLNRYLTENGMTMTELLQRLNMTANEATVSNIVAALTGNVLEKEELVPDLKIVQPENKEINTKDKEGNVWSRPAGMVGGSETTTIGDYRVSRTVGTAQHYYTVMGKDGKSYSFSQEQLDKTGKTLADYIANLTEKTTENKKTPTITTNNAPVNYTMALGEGGGGYNRIPEREVIADDEAFQRDVTFGDGSLNGQVYTMALGEGGGGNMIDANVEKRIINGKTFVNIDEISR